MGRGCYYGSFQSSRSHFLFFQFFLYANDLERDDGSQEIVRTSRDSSSIPDLKVGSRPCVTTPLSGPDLVKMFSWEIPAMKQSRMRI